MDYLNGINEVKATSVRYSPLNPSELYEKIGPCDLRMCDILARVVLRSRESEEFWAGIRTLKSQIDLLEKAEEPFAVFNGLLEILLMVPTEFIDKEELQTAHEHTTDAVNALEAIRDNDTQKFVWFLNVKQLSKSLEILKKHRDVTAEQLRVWRDGSKQHPTVEMLVAGALDFLRYRFVGPFDHVEFKKIVETRFRVDRSVTRLSPVTILVNACSVVNLPLSEKTILRYFRNVQKKSGRMISEQGKADEEQRNGVHRTSGAGEELS